MFRIVMLLPMMFGLCLSSLARADEAEDKAVAVIEKLGAKSTATRMTSW